MDRWTISEPDAGPLTVEGPRLGPRDDDDGVPTLVVVAASHLPNQGFYDAGEGKREKAAEIDFTGKRLLHEGTFLGVAYRDEIHVSRPTRAWEEGGTGGYWVWVKDLNNPERRVDFCVWENWWLLDLPEIEGS